MALSPPMLRLIEALTDHMVDDYLTEKRQEDQQLAAQRPNHGDLPPVDKAA